jgi:hypothetical protein
MQAWLTRRPFNARAALSLGPPGRWLWLLPAAAGLLVTLLIMVVLPPDRTLHGVGDFALKTSPLVLAVITIALFPRPGSGALWLLPLGFVFYLGYVDSASFVHVSALIDAAVAGQGGQFPSYYRWAIFVNAFTVLFPLLAFRLGGASTAATLKLGGAGVLLLLSGLNDLTMWAMYPWPEGRPELFDWASHVSIFLGHAPRLHEMLAFLGLHLLLAGLLLAAPLDRWLRLDASGLPE